MGHGSILHPRFELEFHIQIINSIQLFTSQIVLDEAGAGDPKSAQARLDLLEPLPLLEISQPVLLFAQNIIKSGLLRGVRH